MLFFQRQTSYSKKCQMIQHVHIIVVYITMYDGHQCWHSKFMQLAAYALARLSSFHIHSSLTSAWALSSFEFAGCIDLPVAT